ncbi:hypothetical protein FS842_007972, partial [Serendipita sp. 407]
MSISHYSNSWLRCRRGLAEVDSTICGSISICSPTILSSSKLSHSSSSGGIKKSLLQASTSP